MPPRSTHVLFDNDRDGDAAKALIALAAFNGAVIGLVGCIAAALRADVGLTIVAASGTMTCAAFWKRNLLQTAA